MPSRVGGEGFDEFLDAEMPRLISLAVRLTGNRDDAWDLVQEALIRVGMKWNQVDRNGNPAAYAQKTMLRLHWKRSRRSRERHGGPLPEIATHDPALESVDSRDWIASLLEQLGPRQRAVIVLRYCYDLELAEIAARLGCSVGTVKSQHSRAIQHLRAIRGPDPRFPTTLGGPVEPSLRRR